MRHGALLLVAGLYLSACAPAPAPAPGTGPGGAGGLAEPVEPGYGTLRQDDVTIDLRSGPVLVKVTPLEEWVIRLTALDTYRRLGELASQQRAAGAQGGTRTPALFLVSFFSEQPEVSFQPQDLELVNRGRRYRPLLVRGITSGWGTERLSQRETQTAIYSFDPGIDLTLDLTVEYGDARSGEWTRILQLLQTEAARARARSGGRNRAESRNGGTGAGAPGEVSQPSRPYFRILR